MNVRHDEYLMESEMNMSPSVHYICFIDRIHAGTLTDYANFDEMKLYVLSCAEQAYLSPSDCSFPHLAPLCNVGTRLHHTHQGARSLL